MPRELPPEGKWVTLPVRVRESLLGQIDTVRGEHNRSEWAREALRSVIAADPRLSAKPPLEVPSAGVITDLSDAEVDSFVEAVPEGREPAPAKPPRKPRKPAAAPKTVTPAPEGVPAAAFQEPAEPALVPRQKAPCKHPGVGRKQRCRECGQFNV